MVLNSEPMPLLTNEFDTDHSVSFSLILFLSLLLYSIKNINWGTTVCEY